LILYQAIQIFIGGTDILGVRGQNALAGAGTLAFVFDYAYNNRLKVT
jgi:hypothetical protein